MIKTVKFEDKEYEFEKLSDKAKTTLNSLQFVESRILELKNYKAVLQRAKNSYLDSLKKEMISDKAGFLFGDD